MARSRRRRKRRPRTATGGEGSPAAASEGATPRPEPAASRAPKPRLDADEPPPAPWGSFPLVELVVLVALVMLVWGFFSQGERSAILIGTGLVLGSLAGLELSIREHFSGYRSHTLLLAGGVAVGTLAALFYLAPSLLDPPLRLAAAALAFGLAAAGLTVAFRRRSGGYAFRIRGWR